LIKTGQKNPKTLFFFLSLSLSLAAALSSFSSYFSGCSLTATKDRVINPILPNGPLHTWASIGQVLGHPHIGGKPNPTNLPLPD